MEERTKNKAPDCGCGCTYRLRILGNPSGILSRRKEEPHSDEQKDRELTGSQDAINNQAARMQACVCHSGAPIIVLRS